MLSAGLLLFTPHFSWSAGLVKPGFFTFVQFRQLPLNPLLTRFETIPRRGPFRTPWRTPARPWPQM
jgi:hypothetical protein